MWPYGSHGRIESWCHSNITIWRLSESICAMTTGAGRKLRTLLERSCYKLSPHVWTVQIGQGTMEKMSKNQNDIWMQNIDIWIQVSKRFKTGRIFVFMGLFGKAGMAARKLKWNRLVSAGSFDEWASTSAWNVSRQGLRVFPHAKTAQSQWNYTCWRSLRPPNVTWIL